MDELLDLLDEEMDTGRCPLLLFARQVIPCSPEHKQSPDLDIELPDQQNHAQGGRAAQRPSRNVGSLFQAGGADMVIGIHVDLLQAVSHCSLQSRLPLQQRMDTEKSSGIPRKIRGAFRPPNRSSCLGKSRDAQRFAHLFAI